MNKDTQIPKAVIFDIDGTLYDQRKLRFWILLEILRTLPLDPKRIKDMKILWDFRKAREKNSLNHVNEIETRQYLWGAKRARCSPEKVRCIVQEWVYVRPLKHLQACRYPDVMDFFSNLGKRGILTGAFSDYPPRQKLKALGLSADIELCATDREVDRFKPDPKGLTVIAEKLGISIQDCLYVGDRDEKDGECARRAGMPYLIMDRRNSKLRNCFQSYYQLNKWIEGWES